MPITINNLIFSVYRALLIAFKEALAFLRFSVLAKIETNLFHLFI